MWIWFEEFTQTANFIVDEFAERFSPSPPTCESGQKILAEFIFIRRLDNLQRENRGCVNRLGF